MNKKTHQAVCHRGADNCRPGEERSEHPDGEAGGVGRRICNGGIAVKCRGREVGSRGSGTRATSPQASPDRA